MQQINLNDLSASLISGGTGDNFGTISIVLTPEDLNNLVRPSGPVRPLPAHIDPQRPVWIGPDEGIGFWARRPNQPQQPQQPQRPGARQ